MAKVLEMNMAEYEGWLAGRPKRVREMVEAHPPDRLYRLKTTGQYVTIEAYAEDGTVRVVVWAVLNPSYPVSFDVFGVDPEDLEECDIPDGVGFRGTPTA